jgi:hypothetical protein
MMKERSMAFPKLKISIVLFSFMVFLAALVFAVSALANNSLVPNAKLVGEARYKYLLWSVFDAKLFAPNGQLMSGAPFALQLTYLRDFSDRDLAKQSVEEMRKQGFKNEVKLAAWYREMERIFPSVKKGTTITGVHAPGVGAHFYFDRQFIGTVKDQEFSSRFFSIWLGPQANDQIFRRKLLGG